MPREKRAAGSQAADAAPRKQLKGNDGSKHPKLGISKASGPPRPDEHVKLQNGAAKQYPAAKQPPQNEKLTTHERKEKKRAKMATVKKNFGLIQEAVALWEALRPRQTSKTEKQELVDKIMKKVQGKVAELAAHHTASRVIQFCAKEGNDQQRAAIMAEVRASIVPLAKSKYGHHLVKKLIHVSKKEEVPGLIALFKGHVAELLRHPQGSDVLVDLYDVASTPQRNAMCAEFYGKEFVLFDGVQQQGNSLTSLSQLLSGVNSSKRRSIMQHMSKALIPVMEKAILHPPMVHRLLKDFLECAPSMSVEDAIDTLSQTGTSVLKMVHTHEGAAVACMLLAYGSPRDRKRLVKSFKGFVKEMATNEWGHAVLCTALTVVDDTALLQKSVVSDLKALLGEFLEDQYAHRVLLQLLSPSNRRYLPPAILDMMQPPQRTVQGSASKAGADIDGDEDEVHPFSGALQDNNGDDGDDDAGDELFSLKKGKQGKRLGKSSNNAEAGEDAAGAAGDGDADVGDTGDAEADDAEQASASGKRILGLSKKDPVVRRKELLGKGPASLGAALTAACSEQTGPLLRSQYGADVIVEVARGGDAGVLLELCPDGVRAVQDAIVAEAAKSVSDLLQDAGNAVGPAPKPEHVLVHYYSSRALRRLVLSSSEEGAATACAFVESLWAGALKGHCKQWVGTHADKVLAALLHSGSSTVKQQATKELQPLVKQPLAKWAQALVATSGTEKAKHQESTTAAYKGDQGMGKRKHQGVEADGQQLSRSSQEQQPQQPQQPSAKQAKPAKQQKASASASPCGQGPTPAKPAKKQRKKRS